jgi:hypothetical protein
MPVTAIFKSCRRRSDSSESVAVATAPAQIKVVFLPSPSTTARPSLARPGSTPSTRLSNIRSPESRCALCPEQRPSFERPEGPLRGRP